jgi:nucleoside-diphosphate-sugar epimerase
VKKFCLVFFEVNKESNMNNLAVIFGTGPLGRATMNELVKRGEHVRMINRSGTLEQAPKNVEIVAADASNLESAIQASHGASVIFNCVGTAYTGQAWETQMPILWNNILQAAISSKAKLVIGDNLYVYDQVGTGIHENLPHSSTTRKGRARIRVVETMLEAHRSGRAQVTFVRGSDFFGPYAGDQSQLGSRVFPALLAGKAVQLIGNPDMPHTLTFIEDFGRAMVMVADHDQAFGHAWHVPNAPTQTRREVLEVAARMVDQPLRIQSMNALMLRGLGLFVPILREVSEMMYQSDKPYIVDSSQFIAQFGDIHTPLEVALEQTIAWFADRQRNPRGTLQTV